MTGEDDTQAYFQWRRRHARQRKVKTKKQEEEEEAGLPPSPEESQSSSVDALFPAGQTSAPFRVVEVDATSVYSSNFSQKEVRNGRLRSDVVIKTSGRNLGIL